MTTTATDCEHFWKVEPPRGPASTDRGEFCHTVRTFSNLEQNEGRPSWQHTQKNQGVKVRY